MSHVHQVDADVLPGEGQHQQRHQHLILDRRAAERIVERVGAKIPDHVMALLGDIGANVGEAIVSRSSLLAVDSPAPAPFGLAASGMR